MARWIGPRGWAFDVRNLSGRQIIHLGQHGAIVADFASVQQLNLALTQRGLSLAEFSELPATEAR